MNGSGAALLERYGSATRAEVARCLETSAPSPFLDEMLADYPTRGGKMLRPTICIANARAFGHAQSEDTMQVAVRCAAAIEMLHNALLIHDDIQDGSELRRGRPTLHAMHGVPLAINAGDALLFTAFQSLLAAVRPFGAEVIRQVIDVTMTMARLTAEGQALELGWRDTNVSDVTEADYLRMALKKTAWMGMIWPAQVGLIVGSQGRGDVERVIRFGHFLGLAFQIEDDVRNLSEDPGYGKEQNGDLFEAKRTLMLIHVLGACDAAERARIERFLALAREQRSPDDVLWLAHLMQARGSISHARAVAAAMAGAATHEFEAVYGALEPSEDVAFLGGLVRWVFDRP